ncbi:MAG: protoporphyrinogen/coproporphyrinogen oxidase [bacterium]
MRLSKKKTDILIAGAGIAGCAAANELQANGIDYLLVEKNIEPGGLTRSISIDDAYFDYTGHFLNLARFKSPASLPHANLNDEDWMLVERKSSVFIDEEMVPAPLQYNLYYLPEALREKCIMAFRNRPKLKKIISFKEYLQAGFGRGICDFFLFPYNEKIMDCNIEELSVESVKRFFPIPDPDMIERGYSIEGENLLTGYNSTFWYPKRSGIGLLAKGLAENLNNLLICCPVEKIDLNSRCAYTRGGKIYFERMLTSIPLKRFCTLTNDPELHNLAAALRHTRVFCLNVLFKGIPPKVFKGSHWIYIPDKKVPFYRVGIYSHISPNMNPKRTTAFYVEVAFSDNKTLPVMSTLLDEIFFCLEKVGWAKRQMCTVLTANWIDCAYVYFDHNRKETVEKIFNKLSHNKIHPIGRYGLWDYITMEDAIISGIETARILVQ